MPGTNGANGPHIIFIASPGGAGGLYYNLSEVEKIDPSFIDPANHGSRKGLAAVLLSFRSGRVEKVYGEEAEALRGWLGMVATDVGHEVEERRAFEALDRVDAKIEAEKQANATTGRLDPPSQTHASTPVVPNEADDRLAVPRMPPLPTVDTTARYIEDPDPTL